jgi:murein DD-endopeptidase MepM/ murein hydrolase activator NlpD
MSGHFHAGLWAGAAAVLVALGSCSDGQAANTPANTPVKPATPPAAISPARPTATPAADFTVSGAMTQGGWLQGLAPGGTAELTFDGAPVPLSSDGRFLIAFDRDAAPAANLQARLANGRIITRALAITPRAWQIERIAIGPRPGAAPSEEFARRRAIETARINAARRINAISDGWRQNFIWPATGRISGRFGSQRIYRGQPGSYHSGMDIAGASGTPILAPADGVVILAADSPFTLEGNLLMIDHGMGLNSAFLHCSQLLVHEGDRIRQGQVIARIGMTGRATGPHLHWSMKWRNSRLDPLLFVGAMPPPR